MKRPNNKTEAKITAGGRFEARAHDRCAPLVRDAVYLVQCRRQPYSAPGGILRHARIPGRPRDEGSVAEGRSRQGRSHALWLGSFGWGCEAVLSVVYMGTLSKILFIHRVFDPTTNPRLNFK